MTNTVTVRPIRTEADLRDAERRLGQIINAQPGTAEYDELEVLSALASEFEKKHYALEGTTPAEVVKFFMEQNSLRPVDLVPYFGSQPRVSDFLNGKRELTVRQITSLSAAMHIPASLLLPAAVIERGWTVPDSRMHCVYAVAKREPLPDGSVMLSLAPLRGAGYTVHLTCNCESPDFTTLQENDRVYLVPDGSGSVFPVIESDGKFEVLGYRRAW